MIWTISSRVVRYTLNHTSRFLYRDSGSINSLRTDYLNIGDITQPHGVRQNHSKLHGNIRDTSFTQCNVKFKMFTKNHFITFLIKLFLFHKKIQWLDLIKSFVLKQVSENLITFKTYNSLIWHKHFIECYTNNNMIHSSVHIYGFDKAQFNFFNLSILKWVHFNKLP